jgi:glycosyltransferase involved in cell wall biosynthesis
VKILFPYLARVRAANWSRYQQLLISRARAGDEVTVLQPPARRSAETNFCEIDASFPERFRVEEVGLWPRFWNTRFPFDKIVKKGAYSLAANRRARSLGRSDRPDVLLLYNLTQESLLSYPAPVVFDVADDLPAMLRVEGRIAGKVLEGVARRALERMIRDAALVTTPSRVLLPRLGPGAVFVPNGVDLEEILSARRTQTPAAGESGPIGFLGSFEYFIDFDLVLGLAGRLPARRFLLIGGGRRLQEVKERVDRQRLGNVELVGPLAHPRALEMLAGCALSLCPFTRDEVGHGASPLKLFESLALGVPVLATRTREIEAERAPNVLFADSPEEASAAIAAYEGRPRETRRRELEDGADEILRTRTWERIGDAWAERIRALSPRPAR